MQIYRGRRSLELNLSSSVQWVLILVYQGLLTVGLLPVVFSALKTLSAYPAGDELIFIPIALIMVLLMIILSSVIWKAIYSFDLSAHYLLFSVSLIIYFLLVYSVIVEKFTHQNVAAQLPLMLLLGFIPGLSYKQLLKRVGGANDELVNTNKLLQLLYILVNIVLILVLFWVVYLFLFQGQ